MIREFCAQNLTNVREAILAGADRVELCDDLASGGTTPTDDVIREAVELVHGLGAAVMVMVRPRPGDFAYDEAELRAMERTISVASEEGADGVVLGCVRSGALDADTTRRLARAARARGLDLTFHMAFDEIREADQARALVSIAELGFSRVLTHGGPLSVPPDACVSHLRELVDVARGHIGIMPGGGVTWQNAADICERLGVDEAHGTHIVPL